MAHLPPVTQARCVPLLGGQGIEVVGELPSLLLDHRPDVGHELRHYGGRLRRVIDEVLAANQAFYDAHESRDMDAMRRVWEHSDRTVCTHPGWPILRTWPLIEASWRRILEGPGRNQFIVTNAEVSIAGEVAWVSCDENLVAGGATGTVAATNVFARSADGWKLVVHHGSPVMG